MPPVSTNDYLDKVKVEPIGDDDFDIEVAITGPLEMILPKPGPHYPRFRLTGYADMGGGYARKFEVDVLLAGPVQVTIERLNLPGARNN